MIIKSFELDKINVKSSNFYLFYGENEGYKNEAIEKIFNINISKNIYRYEEKEILDNFESFFESIQSKSFFEKEKLIIISRVSDKIKNIIEEIIEKNIEDIKIVLNSGILEKKSKLRSLFEKNKNTICVPFYADSNQTLSKIINNFFREKKIIVSQEKINLLIDRCRGNRQNLRNELDKIDSFVKNKKNINIDQIMKLTNLAENYNVSELIDSYLAANFKKTINILNENNFSIEDCMLITRTLLVKSKRLYKLLLEINNNKSIEEVISSFKPLHSRSDFSSSSSRAPPPASDPSISRRLSCSRLILLKRSPISSLLSANSLRFSLRSAVILSFVSFVGFATKEGRSDMCDFTFSILPVYPIKEAPPIPAIMTTHEAINAGLAYLRKSIFVSPTKANILGCDLSNLLSTKISNSSRVTTRAVNMLARIPIVSVMPKPCTGPCPFQ